MLGKGAVWVIFFAAALPAFAGPELFFSTGLSVLGATAGLQSPVASNLEVNLRGAWLPRAQSIDAGMEAFTDASFEGGTRLFLGPELLYYRGRGARGGYQKLYAQLMLGGEHRICGRLRLALEAGPGLLLRNGFAGAGLPNGLPFSLMARSQVIFPLI
jgi:hypothetical protein